MAMTHQELGIGVDLARPYKHTSTADLAMWLEMQFSDGKPFDAAMVFEVTTRAIDAGDPHAADTAF